jgi:phosphate transport system ATP-binding protein
MDFFEAGVRMTYPWTKLQERPECCEPHTLLKVSGLSLTYAGGKTAFRNINANISKGCITALVGPSGCGKSSFLLTLNRLHEAIPGTKLTGDIEFQGQSLFSEKVNLRSLRQSIGMVFQKPSPFPISIGRNLLLPLKENGIRNSTEQKDRIEQVLQDVGLWKEVSDRLNGSALELSGGQQQRLCIARAMMLKPQVLLMDEPCSALDPISSGVVEDLICSLRGTVTVIIVTHNLAQARRIADWTGVFWVKETCGELIEFGKTKSIFQTPQHAITENYIGGIRG